MVKMWLLVAILCCIEMPGLSSHQHEPVDPEAIGELCSQLQKTTLEAENLYAATSSKASICLKAFLERAPSIGNDTIEKIDRSLLAYGPSHCRGRFEYRVKSIRHNAHIEAEYNADNHQKYFLGHMLVHRMHLNKSSLFVRRAEEALRVCGSSCNSPGVLFSLGRYYRSARQELHRVADDIQHSRLGYRDLLLHSARRLVRITRRAERLIERAKGELYKCAGY